MMLISFFVGGIVTLMIILIFLMIIPQQSEDEKSHLDELTSSIEIYYFALLICFILAATGFCVQTFRKYNVNYAFIFEIDTHYRLIHHQLYRVAIIFSFIWFFCLVWQFLQIKLNEVFDTDLPIFTILLVISFLTICCLPFHVCYLRGRIQVAKTLFNIFISPFGKVRFRHFFLADVITSMTASLENTATITCYFATGDFETSTAVSDLKGQCLALYDYKILMGFLPYWFRFAQCLNKYHDSGLKNHLINAGKYFSDLCVPFAALYLVKPKEPSLLKDEVDVAFWIYLTIKIISATYSYAWDIYMDWGLLR